MARALSNIREELQSSTVPSIADLKQQIHRTKEGMQVKRMHRAKDLLSMLQDFENASDTGPLLQISAPVTPDEPVYHDCSSIRQIREIANSAPLLLYLQSASTNRLLLSIGGGEKHARKAFEADVLPKLTSLLASTPVRSIVWVNHSDASHPVAKLLRLTYAMEPGTFFFGGFAVMYQDQIYSVRPITGNREGLDVETLRKCIAEVFGRCWLGEW